MHVFRVTAIGNWEIGKIKMFSQIFFAKIWCGCFVLFFLNKILIQ